MKFVIIGGDAAGMSAASRAKRNNPNLDVTVLEKTHDVSYSACGMPYNIADSDRPIDDLVVRQATVFREKQGINLLTGHSVESIDLENQSVSGTIDNHQKFTVLYDKLLIATGASPIFPDLPGFELPGVFGLKTLEEGRFIKEYLEKQKVGKVVIIGMGYIALEMSEALRSRNMEVEMVKPRPQLLPWMDNQLAEIVKLELEKNEVKLHLGHAITEIVSQPGSEGLNGKLRVISSGLVLDADMVITAIGVKPNSDFAGQSGLELGLNKAITVDRNMLTSNKHVYAAGDCADAYHVVTGKKTYVPLALRANRAGWAVADNIFGKNIELPGIAGTSVFKVFDLEVARTGLDVKDSIANGFDVAEVYVQTRSRAHAHPGSTPIHLHMVADRNSGRLLGAQMVGREGVAHRINAVAVALHSQMTVEQFVQCDLAYAPPFSPVWDPLLTTANQLLKNM